MLTINNYNQMQSNCNSRVKFSGRHKLNLPKFLPEEKELDLCAEKLKHKKDIMKQSYSYYNPGEYDRNPIVSSTFRDEELYNPLLDEVV